jgi:hypothetical protein
MEDSRQALSALDRLADLKVGTLLPGYGDPLHESLSDAVAEARAAGIS